MSIKEIYNALRERRKMLNEARDNYQKRAHKDLDRWPNEDQEHFERRKKKHQERVRKALRVQKHLRAKCKHLAKRLKKKKSDKNDLNPKGGEIVSFDGKACVEWIAYWLQKSRDHGWDGYLVSGYRTPEYSQQLCYQICGAPSCPGRCAGTSSNHCKKGYLQGAVDVSDYTNFERIQFAIGSPLRNDLPIDPVHFSATGH